MRADATFPAMGATAHVMVVDGPIALLGSARARLAELECRWSRFVPTSEVSRLNRAAGQPLAVSADTRLLVRRALEGHAVTGGAFDPTLLGAVLRGGYGVTFSRLAGRARPVPSLLRTGADRIEVDDDAGTVRVPERVGFDPGGIGKGLAADLVAGELLAAGAAGACVNVGGDLRVMGVAPDGDAWHVDVDHPVAGEPPLARLRLHDAAVATSSPRRRSWLAADGTRQHHLIDPRRGVSASSPVMAATAVAAAGWQAEVLAKAAFLDAVDGLALASRVGAAALIVVPDGVLTSATWSATTSPSTEVRS